jgi:hypothetical protein
MISNKGFICKSKIKKYKKGDKKEESFGSALGKRDQLGIVHSACAVKINVY